MLHFRLIKLHYSAINLFWCEISCLSKNKCKFVENALLHQANQQFAHFNRPKRAVAEVIWPFGLTVTRSNGPNVLIGVSYTQTLPVSFDAAAICRYYLANSNLVHYAYRKKPSHQTVARPPNRRESAPSKVRCYDLVWRCDRPTRWTSLAWLSDRTAGTLWH